MKRIRSREENLESENGGKVNENFQSMINRFRAAQRMGRKEVEEREMCLLFELNGVFRKRDLTSMSL